MKIYTLIRNATLCQLGVKSQTKDKKNKHLYLEKMYWNKLFVTEQVEQDDWHWLMKWLIWTDQFSFRNFEKK